ncbi:MAG: 50S ribosomal protein L6 [Nanoarchaeota archaeon]
MEQAQSKLEKSLNLAPGVTARKEGSDLVLKGPKGEAQKSFASAQVEMSIGSDAVKFTIKKNNRNQRRQMNTFLAHIKNMQKGVVEGHHYLLRICSGHFPMNVAVTKDELVVKNYVGERVPRSIKIPSGVQVKVNGRDITVDSSNKDIAGMTASRIEGMTKRANFDKRRFQDGIYIVLKDGKGVR